MSNKILKEDSAKTASVPKKPAGKAVLLLLIPGVCAIGMLVVFGLFGFKTTPKELGCSPSGNLSKTELRIKDTTLSVEVAEKNQDRFKGLSGRECLNNNAGMLFVFDVADTHCFVMRDMRFAIDMVWLDQSKKIAHIKENAQPESYPAETFCPDKPSLYVLEVASGAVNTSGWKVGDQVSF